MNIRFRLAGRVLRPVAMFVCAAVAVLMLASAVRAETPLLLRNPSLSKTSIAFLYANDVWTVSRHGGVARRLTSQNDVVAGPLY